MGTIGPAEGNMLHLIWPHSTVQLKIGQVLHQTDNTTNDWSDE